MVTMTTTVFKKMSLITLALACAAGVVLSVGLKTAKNETNVNAATVETSRIWMQVINKDEWDSAGAHTHIHYWGGSSSTAWPGVNINYDANNDKCYYDVPPNTTGVIFVRMSGDTVWNQTADLSAVGNMNTSYFSLTGYGGGSWVGSFTASTTVNVANYAGTLDTIAEACNSGLVATAVNSYNAMPTFEQDQFDVLSVGGGITGLQRLMYLKTFYGNETALTTYNIGSTDDTNSTALLILSIIGIIGLSTLGAYYVISRKRRLN